MFDAATSASAAMVICADIAELQVNLVADLASGER